VNVESGQAEPWDILFDHNLRLDQIFSIVPSDAFVDSKVYIKEGCSLQISQQLEMAGTHSYFPFYELIREVSKKK
jgi:hypothetical protein